MPCLTDALDRILSAMSGYIPRGGPFKPLERLKKHEKELLSELRSPLAECTTQKIFRAAEKVRSAHLTILKAKRHYLFPYDERFEARVGKLDLQIAEWTSKTVEEIVKKYKAT